ncbi:hypothetical protein [Microbacterium sp. P03]|uniref:hypothetical protein n=1 Tax=Microbacterium sp. P03 TaxID=3366946 RepID=UPI0037471F08
MTGTAPPVVPRALGEVARRRIGYREPLVVVLGAVLVVVVHAQGIGVPSPWYDEAATYSGASRTWSSLWSMLGSIDAVHGLYYALLHPLAHAVGPDMSALRLTSALCVGATAAAVYALARLFGTAWSAAAAAILSAGLGRATWMSTEARSFALATLLASVLTLLLVVALRARRATAPALAYGAVALVAIHVFVYLVFVVGAHVVAILWLRIPADRRWRLLGAAGTAVALSIPLGLVVLSQRGQLGGTFPLDADAIRHVLVGGFFHRELLQALLAWSTLAVAVAVISVRRHRDTTAASGHAASSSPWPVLVPWLVLPAVAVIALSFVGPSVLQPRALVISAPALCVLLAEATRRAFGRVVPLVLVVVIVVAGAGAFPLNRELTSKNADWPLVAAHLASSSTPSDGVLYSAPIDYRTWPSLIGLVYPGDVADLKDLTLLTPGDERAALFAERSSATAAVPAIREKARVFYVRSRALSAADIADDLRALREAGLTRSELWDGPLTSVETWEARGADAP